MDTIKITTGEKRLAVSVDGVNGREISFNPNDVLFIERLHRFYRLALEKADEWQKRQVEQEQKLAAIPTDENGMPETLDAAIEPLQEMNQFMREQIDLIFGSGTSQAVFGDVVYRNPAVYVQLIDGIRPFVEAVRSEKVQKYIPQNRKKTPAKRKPRKRMK